jgi:hypothetical protein
MPYGFFKFVSFAGLVGFGILAYQANQHGRQTEMIIYGGLALLFQPFFKIALRQTNLEYCRRYSWTWFNNQHFSKT